MGTTELLLCICLGHFIVAQSEIERQHARFFHNFPGFLDNIMPFPFESNFDFPPHDTALSSWRFWNPDFQRFPELPPVMIVPRVEVFCDESKLTLLVGKHSNGLVLTGEEIQLGDGCNTNGELPNKFVFTYSLDQCGTTPVMHNGKTMFTNVLNLNLQTPNTWWNAPTTVHISCFPKRSYPNYFSPMTFPETGKTFNIKTMNPSWTSATVSNTYERGQVVNLQVSARTRPELQQLFIQSCFVSGSPDSQTRPKHAVIMNKGCTAPLGSSHAVVQFVASNSADVVNLVLNTSYLISELYIHCSVLISDQGVNFGSKSCNYNTFKSRWVDLSGNVEVCECCISKCKGLSGKNLPEDAKAIVSAGPLVIVEKPIATHLAPSVSELQETASTPVTAVMQSDHAATEDTVVSGHSVSRPPQGVVVMSQDPVSLLTLWLPGQLQDTEQGVTMNSVSDDSKYLSELQPSNVLNPLSNEPGNLKTTELGSDGGPWDLTLTLVDGVAIPPQTEKASFAEDSRRKRRFERSGISDAGAPQEVDVPLTVNVQKSALNQMIEELAGAAVMSQEANDAQPIIRSKLEFTKSIDGSRSLSYEQEVAHRKGVARRDGIQRELEPRRRGGWMEQNNCILMRTFYGT